MHYNYHCTKYEILFETGFQLNPWTWRIPCHCFLILTIQEVSSILLVLGVGRCIQISKRSIEYVALVGCVCTMMHTCFTIKVWAIISYKHGCNKAFNSGLDGYPERQFHLQVFIFIFFDIQPPIPINLSSFEWNPNCNILLLLYQLLPSPASPEWKNECGKRLHCKRRFLLGL